MELKQAILERASVREFTNDQVPIEDLRELVRLAGCAPSANNAQPWKYIAVLQPKLKSTMADAVRTRLAELLPVPGCSDKGSHAALCHYCTLFEHAPAVLVVATRTYEGMLDKALERVMRTDPQEFRGHIDEASLGASIENLLLAAADRGYGTCWLTGPLVARPELEDLLSIERPWRLGALIALGRPLHPTKQSEKVPVEQIFEVRT